MSAILSMCVLTPTSLNGENWAGKAWDAGVAEPPGCRLQSRKRPRGDVVYLLGLFSIKKSCDATIKRVLTQVASESSGC
jgi:hypothetical protein